MISDPQAVDLAHRSPSLLSLPLYLGEYWYLSVMKVLADLDEEADFLFSNIYPGLGKHPSHMNLPPKDPSISFSFE